MSVPGARPGALRILSGALSLASRGDMGYSGHMVRKLHNNVKDHCSIS